MDVLVLNTDIARLVHGYLNKHHLERASRVFCKTSPHLQDELCAYHNGLQVYNFWPELEEIICEYVKITRTVELFRGKLENTQRLPLHSRKVSENIVELFNLVDELLSSTDHHVEPSVSNANDPKPVTETVIKESTITNTKKPNKRKLDAYLSDEGKRAANAYNPKRRRISDTFCLVDSSDRKYVEDTHFWQKSKNDDETTSTSDETDEAEEQYSNDIIGDDIGQQNQDQDLNLSCLARKPIDESTPRPRRLSKNQYNTPSVTEISQAILDNREFQMKLVDNINHALNISNVLPTELDAASLAVDNVDEKSNKMFDQMVKEILAVTENDPTFEKIVEDVVGSSNTVLTNKSVSTSVQCNMDATTPTFTTETGTQHGAALIDSEPTIMFNNLLSSGGTDPPRTPLIIRTAMSASYGNNNEAQFVPSLAMANTSFGSLIDPNYSISKLIVLNSKESAQKQPNTTETCDGQQLTMGNTTTENILSQLTTGECQQVGMTPVTDEQICFDAATGQLTFPVYLTSDGLLTNFPFLISNELMTQAESGKPIMLATEQLPPNTIILGSNQKITNLSGTDEQQSATVTTVMLKDSEPIENTLSVDNAPVETLRFRVTADQNVPPGPSLFDRATPSCSGIVNGKGFRSLSTPRKRASHVRTLSFSPKCSNGSLSWMGLTPLSTRRETMSRLRSFATKSTIEQSNDGDCETEAKSEEHVKGEDDINKLQPPEKPIIKNIEILPRLATVDTSTNDSSNNSCNVPPLFAGAGSANESSNQTIIKREELNQGASAGQIGAASDNDAIPTTSQSMHLLASLSDTPKRKQQRQVAVRACKRQLSKSSNEDNEENSEFSKVQMETKIIELIESETTPIKTPIQSCENPNDNSPLEHSPEKVVGAHEEVASTSTGSGSGSIETESSTALDESQKEVSGNEYDPMLAEWQKMRNCKKPMHDLDVRLREIFAQKYESTNPPKKKRVWKRKRNPDESPKQKQNTSTDKSTPDETDGKRKSQRKEEASKKRTKAESKMKAPIKTRILGKNKGNDKNPASKKSVVPKGKLPSPSPSPHLAVTVHKETKSSSSNELCPELSPVIPISSKQINNDENAMKCERDKRTSNIACLLETPFKEITTATDGEHQEFLQVPPTPCISMLPSAMVKTPLAQIKTSGGPIINDVTMRLFGSLTKSELGDTPLLTAITPALRFTPYDSLTPRSAPGTEYSSGGGSSYYRPDESDDLDHNINQLHLDVSTKIKKKPEPCGIEKDKEQFKTPTVVADEQITMNDDHNILEPTCVEIPAEMLRVEPLLLKRVKSFKSGDKSNTLDDNDTAAISIQHTNPHYVLASGLPDISAEDSCSSSSSSSSSSPSSSSSASSNSLSSSDMHGEKPSLKQSTTFRPEEKNLAPLTNIVETFANLSEISSAEDEEWTKLNNVDTEQNTIADTTTTLVSHDGEVRYPVRSWLTPLKTNDPLLVTPPLLVTLPITSPEKRSRALDELEAKRRRMKEKLKQDCEQQQRTSNRTMQTSHTSINSGKRVAQIKSPESTNTRTQARISPPPTPLHSSLSRNVEEKLEEHRPIDVLTALHLSAKKRDPSNSSVVTSSVSPLCWTDDNATPNVFASSAASAATSRTKSNARTNGGEIVVPALQTLLTTVPKTTGTAPPTTTTSTSAVKMLEKKKLKVAVEKIKNATKIPSNPVIISPRRAKLKGPIKISPDKPNRKMQSTKSNAGKKTGASVTSIKTITKSTTTISSNKTSKSTIDGGNSAVPSVKSNSPSVPVKSDRAKVIKLKQSASCSESSSSVITRTSTKNPTPAAAMKQRISPRLKTTNKKTSAPPNDKKNKATNVCKEIEKGKEKKMQEEPTLKKSTPKKKEETAPVLESALTTQALPSQSFNKVSSPKSIQSKTLEPIEVAEADKSKIKEDTVQMPTPQSTIESNINSTVSIPTPANEENSTKQVENRALLRPTIEHDEQTNAETTRLDVDSDNKKLAQVALTKLTEETVETKKADSGIVGVHEDNESVESDDKPLRFVTFTDAAGPYFTKIIYEGAEEETDKPPENFMCHSVSIVIDDDETHLWRESGEILIYSADPNPTDAKMKATTAAEHAEGEKTQPAIIRNIPKKRKIRVATSCPSDESLASLPKNLTQTGEKLNRSTNGTTSATTTKMAQESETKSTMVGRKTDPTDKLQLSIDIESILSHLHPTTPT